MKNRVDSIRVNNKENNTKIEKNYKINEKVYKIHNL